MIDSEPISFKATELVIEKYGHSVKELPKEVIDNSLGRRIVDFLAEYREILKIDASPEQMKQERHKIFMELVKDVESMPGLLDSLEFFKSKEMKIAIASSAYISYIKFVLDKFKIRDYVNVIISADDVSKGKPDPETYLRACSRLGVKPEYCIVLEDAPNGIQSAKAAGCKCIAIKNPDQKVDLS